MTPSEKFVYDISRAACLSLWTYPNPQGKEQGKELCDVLVVCRPDIIIFSVKEIELNMDGDPEVQTQRWKRRAVESSVSQVYGAQRQLASVDEVVREDGTAGVNLGPVANRRVHRIAVAIGSDGKIRLDSQDFGKGFVHVFDADTILRLLNELDTVVDFVGYLAARETLAMSPSVSRVVGTEDDFLGYYLSNDGDFSPLVGSDKDVTIILGLWDEYSKSEEYDAKKKADVDSYVWDRLITQVHNDYQSDWMEFGGDLASVDAVTRAMAREDRFYRRFLSAEFKKFVEDLSKRSTLVMNKNSKTHYLFLKVPHTEPRKKRVEELQLRAFVARDAVDQHGLDGIIIGLATEVRTRGSGFSLDCLLLDMPTWDDEDRALAAGMRKDLGLFKEPQMRELKA